MGTWNNKEAKRSWEREYRKKIAQSPEFKKQRSEINKRYNFKNKEKFAALRKANKQPKKQHTQQCKNCLKIFLGPRKRAFCSNKCTAHYWYVKYKSNKKSVFFICKQCGAEKESKYGDKARSYCSDVCKKRAAKITSRQSRRAKEKSVLSTLTVAQWRTAKKVFNNSCAYCGSSTHSIEQDHFVPLSQGGPYTSSNIIPACAACNFSKSDSSFFDWYPRQLFYSINAEEKILRFLRGINPVDAVERSA